jgi:hypothetical protein
MSLVAGVRWSFRGKGAGAPVANELRARLTIPVLGASSAARRHSVYFVKPS